MVNKYDSLSPEQRSLFREVEEDVERERLIQFFKKHGKTLAIVCFAVILICVGWISYDMYRDSRAKKDATDFAFALGQALYEPQKSEEAFSKIAERNSSGFAILARFQVAAQKLNSGENEEAFAELRKISSDKSVPEPFRNLAKSVLAYHLLDEGDSGEEIEALMQPLTSSDSVWRGSAREILALKAYKAKDIARAIELLTMNKNDSGLPDTFVKRSTSILSVIK